MYDPEIEAYQLSVEPYIYSGDFEPEERAHHINGRIK